MTARSRTVAALGVTLVLVPLTCALVLGMPLPQAMLVAALAAGAAALLRYPPTGHDPDFPDPPAPIRNRGARREASWLAMNLSDQDGAGWAMLARLQEVAERRLAALGMSLGRPADQARIERLVGTRAYRVLTLAAGSEASSADFDVALTQVELLGPNPPPTSATGGLQPDPGTSPSPRQRRRKPYE